MLATFWLSVLIGTSASSSFQHVSASPEKEACVTALIQAQGDFTTFSDPFGTVSDAVICLSQSEPDTTISGACVSDLAQAKVNPDVGAIYMLDTLADAVICLSQSEPDTTISGACVSDMVRINSNPNSTIEELLNAISEAVICLART